MQYPSQKLSPNQLIEIAKVTERDVLVAATAWTKSPPDPQFEKILQAEPFTDAAPEFYFDQNLQRYRYKDSGQFVSEAAVRNLTVKLIGQVSADLETIGNLLVQGKINVATWEKATAETLKTLHIQQYTLGKGGVKNMAQRDYGILGNKLGKEYEFLRGFSEDLISKGMSEAQFRYRLALYAESARGSFERGRLEGHRAAGYNWERRIRNALESCVECISYAALGWQPLGTLPNPTQECTCQANCKCTKEFSRTKPDSFLLGQRDGWLNQNLKQPLKRAA